jgi:hypothetical protein
MKQAILFTAFIALIHLSFARTSQVSNNSRGIVYNDTVSVKMPEMRQMLSEIMSVVGLQPNFELREANVSNIEATISHRKRYISYNPEFINRIIGATKDKWAVIALIAHEVAHHLNGHTIGKSGSIPQLELEADEFAGFVLYKLGATTEQAEEVMKYIAGTEPSKTHPARASRMLAIQNGWNKAANVKEITATAKNPTTLSNKGGSN